VLELILDNWIYLVPLGILSLISLAIISHSVVQNLRFPLISDSKWELFLRRLQGNQFTKAKLMIRNNGPFQDLMSIYEQDYGEDPEHLEKNMVAAAQGWISRLESKAGFLPIIANTATLLGLLGTVTGMIQAFLVMRELRVPDPSQLAGGISSALITTAMGLIVAIPSLFFGMWMEKRSIKQNQHLEILVSELTSKRKERFELLVENRLDQSGEYGEEDV
jgi:biopolymer transport protein ExbB